MAGARRLGRPARRPARGVFRPWRQLHQRRRPVRHSVGHRAEPARGARAGHQPVLRSCGVQFAVGDPAIAQHAARGLDHRPWPLPDVVSASNPLSSANPTVSSSGTIGYSTLQFSVPAGDAAATPTSISSIKPPRPRAPRTSSWRTLPQNRSKERRSQLGRRTGRS